MIHCVFLYQSSPYNPPVSNSTRRQSVIKSEIEMAEIKRLKARLENLESLVRGQGEAIRTLQEHFERLRGARNRSRTQYSVDMDSTGTIFEGSFDKMLKDLTSQGDIDFSAILEALRREAFGVVSSWRPVKPEIKLKKKDIVRWMLCARNVHKFSSEQIIFIGGNSSVWTKLVEEVFAEQSRDRKKKVALVKYFRDAAKGTSFFGGFAKILVRVHGERCRSCGSP